MLNAVKIKNIVTGRGNLLPVIFNPVDSERFFF